MVFPQCEPALVLYLNCKAAKTTKLKTSMHGTTSFNHPGPRPLPCWADELEGSASQLWPKIAAVQEIHAVNLRPRISLWHSLRPGPSTAFRNHSQFQNESTAFSLFKTLWQVCHSQWNSGLLIRHKDRIYQTAIIMKQPQKKNIQHQVFHLLRFGILTSHSQILHVTAGMVNSSLPRHTHSFGALKLVLKKKTTHWVDL